MPDLSAINSYGLILAAAVVVSFDAMIVCLLMGPACTRSERRCHHFAVAGRFALWHVFTAICGWLIFADTQSWLSHHIVWLIAAFVVLMAVNALRASEPQSSASSPRRVMNMISLLCSVDATILGAVIVFAQVPLLSALPLIGLTVFVLTFASLTLGGRLMLSRPAAHNANGHR